MAITNPTKSLALRGFDNTASRYKIDGNEVWAFYDKTLFRGLLFTAKGPIGWTRINSKWSDMVSSVRLVRSGEWI